jgi:hypothetical protein
MTVRGRAVGAGSLTMSQLHTHTHPSAGGLRGSAHGAAIGAVALLGIALVVVAATWVGKSGARDPLQPGGANAASAVRLEARTPSGESESSITPSVSERRDAATNLPSTAIAAGRADGAAGLTIELSTVTGLGSDAKPLAHIALELGIDPPALPKQPGLLHCTTDDLGHATVLLPLAAIEEARKQGTKLFWVRVTSPGYQSRTELKFFPSGMTSIPMKLIAARGVSLTGRVFDADGHPIAAQVYARSRLHDGSLVFGGTAEARGDGWFELNLVEWVTVQVTADAGEHGTGSIRDLRVSRDSPCEPVELHVSGPGVLRGHVRDSAGLPNAGLDLLLVVAELDDEEGSFHLKQPRATELELEGRGRTWAQIRTDGEGAFEALGLRSDSFHVRARVQRGLDDYPALLTRSAVRSNGAGLDLVFDRPHIVVHVENEDHSPWTGTCRGYPPTRQEVLSWSSTPTAVVEPGRDEVRLGPWGDERLKGVRVKTGEFAFDVPAGRRYSVGLIGGRQAWVPVDVVVPTAGGRVDVTLVARDGPHGTLVLSAVDPNGAEVRDGTVVRIEDAHRGVPLAIDEEMRGRAWPVRFELPVGEYRVAVEGAADVEDYHGTLRSARKHGRFEANVRVENGRETNVRAVLPVGARLHLKLEGVEQPEDLEALQAGHKGRTGLEYFSILAAITLVADDHWPEPVEFQYEIATTSAAGTHLRAALPIGTEGTSEPVSAGRFRLEARMPGGRMASCDVVLVDGQTTNATLRID